MELCLRPEADEPPAAPPEPGCIAAAMATAAGSTSAPASADGSDGGAPGGSNGREASGGARRGDSDEFDSGQVSGRTRQAPAARVLHAALWSGGAARRWCKRCSFMVRPARCFGEGQAAARQADGAGDAAAQRPRRVVQASLDRFFAPAGRSPPARGGRLWAGPGWPSQ